MTNNAKLAAPMEVSAIDYDMLIEKGFLLLELSDKKNTYLDIDSSRWTVGMNQVNKLIDKLKDRARPIICCAQNGEEKCEKATKLLRRKGIECYNGGAVDRVRQHLKAHQCMWRI